MDEATFHHINNNKHHVEYGDDDATLATSLNKTDRDEAPDKLVNGTAMDHMSIAEMVCDGCAMSKEKGTNTPQEGANKVIDTRWKFTTEQTALIYDLINNIGD